jgi:hypothetical protein
MRDQLHAPTPVPPVTTTSTHCIGGWAGVRTCLDLKEESLLSLLGIELRLVDRPARRLVAITTEISRRHMGVGGSTMRNKMDLTEMSCEDVGMNWFQTESNGSHSRISVSVRMSLSNYRLEGNTEP